MSEFEFGKAMHFFVTVELDGDIVKRRTNVSELVDKPYFENSRFFIPFDEAKLNQEPLLIFRVFVLKSRDIPNDEDALFAQSSLLATSSVPIASIVPELLDIYGLGHR